MTNTNFNRQTEAGNREATVLENESLRVMIDDEGGMIPELSAVLETGEKPNGTGRESRGIPRINAHWLPWFRSNSGKPYNDEKDGAFWTANLLYHLAGSFPCLPSFGGGHITGGINMPPHGWSANLSWKFKDSGNYEGTVWALSVMKSPESAMPLEFRKIDAVVPAQNVYYSSIAVKNNGNTAVDINAGWHNTLGAPFLAKGAIISACADRWITAPMGSEFDPTTRFAPGAEFPNLCEAPLAKGGKVDISVVPGPLGYTDFAAGRVPAANSLGWSSLVNPGLKIAYISFFTGPAAAAEDDIILTFNDLWMQYGGRPFTPWAPYAGGTDLTYCLGTENSVAAYAQGLEYSKQIKKVLNAPVTVNIPGGAEKTLRYGTLFAPYGEHTLDNGIKALEEEKDAILCQGKNDVWRFAADPRFGILKALEKKIQTA